MADYNSLSETKRQSLIVDLCRYFDTTPESLQKTISKLSPFGKYKPETGQYVLNSLQELTRNGINEQYGRVLDHLYYKSEDGDVKKVTADMFLALTDFSEKYSQLDGLKKQLSPEAIALVKTQVDMEKSSFMSFVSGGIRSYSQKSKTNLNAMVEKVLDVMKLPLSKKAFPQDAFKNKEDVTPPTPKV